MENNSEHIEIIMVRYISGEATSEEKDILLAWLKENPDNIKELNAFRQAVSTIKNTGTTSKFDAEKAISHFEKSTNSEKSSNIRKMVLFASSVAAIFILLFGLYFFHSTNIKPLQTLAQSSDTLHQVQLIDGSIVTLNKNAVLQAQDNFTAENRNVILKGEAFFEIQADKKHPFIIQVNNVSVKVVGTSFNIYNDSLTNDVIVTVKTGIVEVTYLDKTVSIRKGDQASFYGSDKNIEVTKNDIINSDSWKTGQIVFENTPLNMVIESLNKNLSANFAIGSPELNNRELMATFNIHDSIDEVIEVLTVVLGVQIENEKGVQTLYINEQNTNQEYK